MLISANSLMPFLASGILTSYDFIVVALGTVILSAASGAVGCVSLHKGQSLIGDAVGHAAFPGIVIAFMFFSTRNPVVLNLGALLAGATAYALIQSITRHTKAKLDAVLAVILSGFFGLGMVLKSYITGNPQFQGASQSGLASYIFGQAAYIMVSDVVLITVVALIALALLFIFYKEIKLFVFNEEYAQTIGLKVSVMYGILLLMVMVLISVGLKVVGAILISSLLVIPAVAANQWSESFGRVLFISALVGAVSAFIGTYISTVYRGMSTGATIILIMGFIALLSMVIGPRGAISQYKKRRNS